jgi:hypothetical protein
VVSLPQQGSATTVSQAAGSQAAGVGSQVVGQQATRLGRHRPKKRPANAVLKERVTHKEATSERRSQWKKRLDMVHFLQV